MAILALRAFLVSFVASLALLLGAYGIVASLA